MTIVLEVVFWLCILAILHSYLFYPLLLKILSAGKKPNSIIHDQEKDLPFVTVIMSVYNEETVIEEKLNCLLEKIHQKYWFDLSSSTAFEH